MAGLNERFPLKKIRILFWFICAVFVFLSGFSPESFGAPVVVEGRKLKVDFDGDGLYAPYIIKGVGYSPYPAGVFSGDWGTCEYCQTASQCFYSTGIVPGLPSPDYFSCSAEQPTPEIPALYGGPMHPWGGGKCGQPHCKDPNNPSDVEIGPQPNKCNNLYDRGDVDLDRDFQQIKTMYANTIRTWEKVTPALLAKASQYDIKVIAGYGIGRLQYNSNGDLCTTISDIVDDFKNYVTQMAADPNFASVLFIAIGNENNILYYDYGNPPVPPDAPGCYTPAGTPVPYTDQMHDWYSLVNQLACAAHAILRPANDRPIAVVNGEIAEINHPEFATTDSDMSCLDIWGANIYRGISFGDLFSGYAEKSQKPLWISECGVDALYTDNFYDDMSDGIYDPQGAHEDQAAQALWMGRQWNEIEENSNITIGANFFNYSDTYWQGNGRIPDSWGWDSLSRQHNNAGQCFQLYSPEPGRMPDGFFNQEWFGIMSISEYGNNPDILTPRAVYYTLKGKFKPVSRRGGKQQFSNPESPGGP